MVTAIDRNTLGYTEIIEKHISINISGIIFHISEDGYDRLKEYLESIQKYFSAFEGSIEIVADIEIRMAEIFLSILKEGKEVLTYKDVEKICICQLPNNKRKEKK